jgi:hypothetical protein
MTKRIQESSKLTQEQPEQKGYVVGSICIDKDGIWSVYYIGHHKVGKKTYFGNGVESSRNIRELLNIVGSRLNNKKEIYTEKIKEVEFNKVADQIIEENRELLDALKDSGD